MLKTPDTILGFPQEIIFNILSRLPTKSLIRFRCVCTSFPPLISHPTFTKLHLTTTVADNHRTIISYASRDQQNHFYTLLSPLTFKETLELQFPSYPRQGGGYRQYPGSSKGLICLFDSSFHSSSGTLILWNPCINKHKILDGPHKGPDRFPLCVFGFGFVSRTCEFKVVGIAYDYGVNMKNIKHTGGCLCCSTGPVIDKNNTVSVYSLSTNSWEKKEGVSAPCYMNNNWFTATFVNGFVNWLAFKEDGSRVIMAFDLDNERFQVFDLPKDIIPNDHGRYLNLSMHSFGEDDSLSLALCAGYREVLDVWVMGEYGVMDSWKKVFVLSQRLFLHPLVMKSDREVLMLTSQGNLVLFDAIKNETQDLGTRGAPADFHAIRYTASLAQLDG